MSLALKYALKKKMAKGGAVREAGVNPDVSRKEWGGAAQPGTSLAGEHVRGANMAKEAGQHIAHGARTAMAKRAHQKTLSELHSLKSKDRTNLARGGMVDRIMSKRCSKGGMIANDTLDHQADDQDAQFDDLVLRDDLESHYTGANSGDELGNEPLNEMDQDMVSRIMRSRAKKDRMPRPA